MHEDLKIRLKNIQEQISIAMQEWAKFDRFISKIVHRLEDSDFTVNETDIPNAKLKFYELITNFKRAVLDISDLNDDLEEK